MKCGGGESFPLQLSDMLTGYICSPPPLPSHVSLSKKKKVGGGGSFQPAATLASAGLLCFSPKHGKLNILKVLSLQRSQASMLGDH